MNSAGHPLGMLRELTLSHMLLILAVLVGGQLLVLLVRRIVRRAAESAPSHWRLVILRTAPLARLAIVVAGIAIIVPILVEPSFEDIIALLAAVSLALAFALKDYVSCVVAGIMTIVEHTYQPGDWIELDGTYGEVTVIGTRAVHLVTADDTEVIIPHAKLWSTSLFNATGGQHSLLVVAEFFLHPDHDGAAVREVLAEIGEASLYREPETKVTVVAIEAPWGTRYRVKAYVAESREQFAMITDLTLRGKERLRAMHITFAQAPYVETGTS
ncbi:MAG: mechanosensitive ion channel [Betaproteobacteria bacterium]|nr:mechanosensitive ion channel [Betaproteobacteria bacterium]